MIGNPILKINNKPVLSLTTGSEVKVRTLTGHVLAVVIKNRYGVFFAENQHSIYNLEFCKERKCWVSFAGQNKAALKLVKRGIENGKTCGQIRSTGAV